MLHHNQTAFRYKGASYFVTIEATCPHCKAFAIIRIPKAMLPEIQAADREQGPDMTTTHVCLPSEGGCNQGFTL